MIIISYDFSNDKIRAEFSKFLKKYGRKLQLSVYELKNSPRVLNNVICEIESNYKLKFSNNDSIIVFNFCEGCRKKIKRYGYAAHEEKDLIFFN